MKYQKIIKRMTIEEKAMMMSGKNIWQTVDFEKYGIPSIFLADGPHGLRKQTGSSDHLGINPSLPATCFPTAATIANSWDEQLGEEIGRCLGEEANTLGINVILGPGLNIKRSPLCGRNFEYFSEDPYLAGKMAASYVRGIQSQGVAACPKHFAANNQELRRMTNDSIVDERTFREIYTTGFEIAVKEGKAKSIMTSYNLINGIYANENEHLLREILVNEWGFEGFVVSDWGGSNDHVLSVKNGSHLEMPSTGKAGVREIATAVHSGEMEENTLDIRLDELLKVFFDLANAKKPNEGKEFDKEVHHQIAKKAAAKSIVLLKNEDNILPLPGGTRVAVIGDFAETPRYQGAGSSIVNPTKLDTTLGLIDQSSLKMLAYAKGYERTGERNPDLLRGAQKAVKEAEVVLVYVGLDEISELEGQDRKHMKMAPNQIELIEAVVSVNPNIVVVLSSGSAIEMPWVHKVKAVIHGYLGGQAGAGAMLDVLTGEVCPSGKLNETYPIKYEDTPAYAYYPGKEKTSEYREGLYVGYRYYETVKADVLFPFGYGLSYTTFAYSDLNVSEKEVSFILGNTGEVDGAEVAQLYIGKRSQDIFRPVKELKGFKKIFLKAGESKEVTIPLDEKAFRYYNPLTNRWETAPGVYNIYVGTNVSEIVLQDEITIAGGKELKPYESKDVKSYFSGKVKSISDKEYECLLGHAIPDNKWKESGLLSINDTISQMYYAKSLLARLVYKILAYRKRKSEAKGKPDLNILFIYHMPFRGIAKNTGGIVSTEMVEAVVEIVNGHFFRGMGHLIKGFFSNRK